MNKSLISFGLFAGVMFFSPSLAASAEIGAKLQGIVERAASQETIPIIVTFAGAADLRPLPAEMKKERRGRVVKALRQTAENNQQSVRAMLHARGKPFEPLWIINGLALKATPGIIQDLAAQPQVERIVYDALIQLPEVLPAAETVKAEWNLQSVHAPELWQAGFSGQGVTIAILDSGVNAAHPDLAGRYLGGPAGWFDPYGQTTAPYDPDGHGTLVAGIALGGSAGGSAIGVAPGARWVAAKIFRDDGSAENSQILKAFQWLLDPDGNPATNDAVVDVANNSWGFEEAPGVCDPLFRPAIQNLKAAGIAVVFSAGNSGPAVGVSPGNYAESFAVGATNRFSLLADFSARGPAACDNSVFPEVVAPGDTIRSSDVSGYAVVSGTSFSAPHVAGVMALLLSAAPGLPPEELEQILKFSASDLGSTGPDNDYGYGLLNARTALQMVGGTAKIAVYDSTPPTDDLTIDFGHVAPGQTDTRTATVRNAGEGFLRIDGIEPLAPPFTLVTDGCSGVNLAAGVSCTIELRFAPGALQTYAGALALYSSNPEQALTTLQLGGIGNSPPPAAQPASPGNGASGVMRPVTLAWTQTADSEGDAIRHTVLVAQRGDFSDALQQQVAGEARGRTVLLAGAGGLILVALTMRSRKRSALAVALLATLVLLVACSGGGDSDDDAATMPAPLPQGESFQASIDNLAADTRYYWKVVSEDARGARVESETFSFITSPLNI